MRGRHIRHAEPECPPILRPWEVPSGTAAPDMCGSARATSVQLRAASCTSPRVEVNYMPRKQRFKPSRKPKPTPAQVEELTEIAAQHADLARTSDIDLSRPPPEVRGEPRREEAEAS